LKSDSLIEELSEDDGIIVKAATIGENLPYIFLHLTFQEYLCACYIVEQASCLSFLEPVLFNPRFREVVRLTAGMLPKEKAWGFIKFILNQKPLCYDVLHQPLLLADLCIADIPDEKADPAVEGEILNELLRLWKETKFDPLRDEINRVFIAMAGTRNGGKIVNNLLGLLEDEDKYVRRDAAKTLGNLGRADDRVIDRLLGLLEDKDSGVREGANEALGKLGRADDRVIDRLLRLLKDEDSYVRENAAEALGNLGRAEERVVDGLFGLLKDENWWVRGNAAEALDKIGRADDKVINGLLGLLEDKDSYVRDNAAKALGKLGRADERVINALRELLEDRVVRDAIYRVLQKLVEKQARETSTRLIIPSAPFEFELTPAGFKSFVETKRIRAETL